MILHDSLDYDQAKYAIQNLEENEKEENDILKNNEVKEEVTSKVVTLIYTDALTLHKE